MFAKFLFHRIQRLLSGRWTRDHGAYEGACEAAHTGRFGPFQLEVSHCYVLDHDTAAVSLALP